MSVIYIAPLGGTSALQGDPTNEIAPIDIYPDTVNVSNLTAAMWLANVKSVDLHVEFAVPAGLEDDEETISRNDYFSGTFSISKSNCLPNHQTSAGIFASDFLYFDYKTWDNGYNGLNLAGHDFGGSLPDYYWPVFKMHYVNGQFKIVPALHDAISRTISPSQIVEVLPYEYEDDNAATVTTSITLTWTVTDTYFAV